ncbi:MAG: FAD-dependent oxidoreductase [Tetrasphaera sp.]
MKRIVVVGNGIAGLTAAESVRDAGFDGELTIIGDEAHAPYTRPALSKAALLDDDPAVLRLPESTHGATEMLGIRVEHVDTGRRVLRLGDGDGDDVPYDGLVIASGSRARHLLPAPAERESAAEESGELTLRSLDDMIRVRRRLHDRPSVVVVGGGPLGMEIASGAIAAGCPVTLVANGTPLHRHLGTYLADLLVGAAREHGVVVRTEGCAGARRGSTGPEVVLHDGTIVAADVLVSAIGDLPNLEWLEGSHLLTGGQLIVDSRGRVIADDRARPDIVAAGDIATFPTAIGPRRVPLWTSAIDQAKVAGPALVRGDEAPALDFRPYFWTEQFGLHLRAAGELPPDGRPEVVDGDPQTRSALLRWARPDAGTAAALNFRYPIPRLRRLAQAQPAPA